MNIRNRKVVEYFWFCQMLRGFREKDPEKWNFFFFCLLTSFLCAGKKQQQNYLCVEYGVRYYSWQVEKEEINILGSSMIGNWDVFYLKWAYLGTLSAKTP